MERLAGLSRWERYWCRRSAFGRWRHTEWMQDAMLLLMLVASAWAIHRRGDDPDAVALGLVAGIALGGLLTRNLPIRTERVIARLTRALDRAAPPDQV